MESAIDELWETIMQTCPILMKDWFNCFDHDEAATKHEINETLETEDRWKDRDANFLLRLVSDDKKGYADSFGRYKPRVQLALAFVRHMATNPCFTDFIVATLNVHAGDEQDGEDAVADGQDLKQDDVSQVDQTDLGYPLMVLRRSEERRGNGILHEAAKGGRCADLERFLAQTDVDAPNNIGETALHLAAEFEHPRDVAILLRAGATLRVDKHGFTPLHSAAMAINPNQKVAGLLVGAVWKHAGEETVMNSYVYRMLNQTSGVASGRNTALHIAAGNVNVTREFIHQLKISNAKIQNAAGDTAFHVAAKCTNPDAIIYMLNTFAPSKGGWDVDDVDENRDQKAPTLLVICATSGNADAVALLIQHGADLAKGVLQEIVIESVKCPEKTNKLLAVYRAIVDNVVTWRCLEENIKLKPKGSHQYNEFLRETMMWLIMRPHYHRDAYDDVILCAIEYGADALLREIINTKDVFRFDLSETKILFDVTDFTRATRADPQLAGSSVSLESDRDYTEQFHNSSTYLRELVLSYDEWREKSILEEQPMRELTKPYFRFVQRCYFLLGVLQLTYMICFSGYYMPSTCFLIDLFHINASVPGCSNMTASAGNGSSNPDPVRVQGNPSWFWLVWPIVLCFGNALSFLVDLFWISVASFCKYAGNCEAGVTHHGAERWPTKVLLVVGQMFPALSFCTSVFVWYYRYGARTNYFSYLEATSMIFLFGWTTNLVFFSGMTQKFCVFALVLKEIIVKDIVLSFLMMFIFTLLGFSFAMHVLRLAELPADNVMYLSATVYDVFVASLGTGDYVQMAREERSKSGIYFDLFEVVVVGYVCVSAIILLNVLIAMMNHRYDKAKRRAENFWRFQILRIALDLELVPALRYMFVALLRHDLEDPDVCGVCCSVCCCYCRTKQLRTDVGRQNRKFLKVKLDIS